jgi:putative transcriptional regulator
MTALQIGNNIRRFRFDQAEMTQAQLAEIVGVTRQTIVALETGRYAPSLELAMKLAAAFACTVDALFFWKDAVLGRAGAQS